MSDRHGRPVRFITLDVGGTLIHPNPSVGAIYAEVLTRRGFKTSVTAAERAFEEAWDESARTVPARRERYTWSPGGERGYWRDLLQATVSKLGGTHPPAGAAEELFERFGHRETWRIYPEVEGVLETLRGRGYRMGVLSNWDSRLPALLREVGLRKYFGSIVVSALEGYEKPDPRIFALAAAREGVELREMLHVGDRVWEDEKGAMEAGCRALIIERNGHPAAGLKAVLSFLDGEGESCRGEVHR